MVLCRVTYDSALFSDKMEAFKAVAKRTHARYGTSIVAAKGETAAKLAIVPKIATTKAKMFASATSKFFMLKNVNVHVRFRTICSANQETSFNPADSAIASAAPMRRYSTVQTGPNSLAGGCQDGFLSARYQALLTSPIDTRPAAVPAASGPKSATQFGIFLSFGPSRLSLFFIQK